MADVRAVDACQFCERFLTDWRLESEPRIAYALSELDGQSLAESRTRTCPCHPGDLSVAK
jgi:hypothetical protein